MREDWGLRRDYTNWLGMHRLVEEAHAQFLRAKAHEAGLTLLPFPCEDPIGTPAALMRPVDLIHAAPGYGALVLRQIAGAIATST